MHKLKKTSVKITKVIDCFFAKKFYSFNCLPQAVALLPYTVSLARNLLLANTYIRMLIFIVLLVWRNLLVLLPAFLSNYTEVGKWHKDSINLYAFVGRAAHNVCQSWFCSSSHQWASIDSCMLFEHRMEGHASYVHISPSS